MHPDDLALSKTHRDKATSIPDKAVRLDYIRLDRYGKELVKF
jgi:hypothetical protein